jgi:DtxR family Mn-dependent transcriptional regulator
MFTETEENYLKAIYKIAQKHGESSVNTKAIADEMGTSSASVTDMIKRLSEKKLLQYEKYYGVSLSKEGQKVALNLLRKHRLWEVFLHDSLGFSWDEVHDVAEQLEHVQSDLLIDKLDQFLGFPKFDPHGDPIPNANGSFTFRNQMPLSQVRVKNSKVSILGVRQHDNSFLKYLNDLKIRPGQTFEVIQFIEYDKSIKLLSKEGDQIVLSEKVADAIFVKSNN